MELHPEPSSVFLSYMKLFRMEANEILQERIRIMKAITPLRRDLWFPLRTGVRARINNIDGAHKQERHFFPRVESTTMYVRDSPMVLPLVRAMWTAVEGRAESGSLGFLIHVPLNRVLHQFSGATQRKLFLNVRLIGFNGLDAEMQFFGDLSGSVTFSNQSEHLEFPVTQTSDGRNSQRAGTGDVVLEHFVGDAVAHVNFTIQNAAHGHQHLLSSFLFHNVTVGAGAERTLCVD